MALFLSWRRHELTDLPKACGAKRELPRHRGYTKTNSRAPPYPADTVALKRLTARWAAFDLSRPSVALPSGLNGAANTPADTGAQRRGH
jgi:hypothetical protein